MSNTPTPRPHVEFEQELVFDDERPVDPPPETPDDGLDRELEVPEADAVEQHYEVPIDADEHR